MGNCYRHTSALDEQTGLVPSPISVESIYPDLFTISLLPYVPVLTDGRELI